MSAFIKGFFITLFAAAFLQGLIGFYFGGSSGAIDALGAMAFYWLVYVAISICVGLVALILHRRRHGASRFRKIRVK